ncbi:MAG TPA: flagellar biosynthetic protein FliR, partial [Alphaproteobacteria bacterium]|nr:flagellar biosynthetic protein FliR [Alphaproteobacteria bacterium]
VFAVFMVFARIGSAFSVLPGFSEAFIAMRFRLMLAGMTSLVIAPIVAPGLPPAPESPLGLLLLLGGEAIIGIFLGMTARLAMAAVQTAGMIIGLQTSLANAFAYDPTSAQQNAVIGAWLSTVAIVLIFVTDLHHLMLRGLVESYRLFQPGLPPPLDDLTEVIVRLVSSSFLLGVKIATPFLVFGFIFFLAAGLIARLMPQVQIFFVTMPLQIMIGLIALGATVGVGMIVFLRGFESVLTTLSLTP